MSKKTQQMLPTDWSLQRAGETPLALEGNYSFIASRGSRHSSLHRCFHPNTVKSYQKNKAKSLKKRKKIKYTLFGNNNCLT